MNCLVRHIDWVLLGVAIVLSAVWVSNYITQPLTEQPPMAIIKDDYVPPKYPLPRSMPMPSTLS